jgi:hypothetical protein
MHDTGPVRIPPAYRRIAAFATWSVRDGCEKND